MPLCRSAELAALWKAGGLRDVEDAPVVVERSALEDRLRARIGEDPFVMKARAWAVKGTRP